MPTQDVEISSYLQAPHVVKCPTPQCRGWITLDSTGSKASQYTNKW